MMSIISVNECSQLGIAVLDMLINSPDFVREIELSVSIETEDF